MQLYQQLDLPLGKITGLLCLSLTILIGVYSGHEPEVIAVRAIISFSASCFAGYIVGRLIVEFLKKT